MTTFLFHAQISKDLEPELKKIQIKEEDLKKYYGKNPEYRTAHILLRIRVKKTKEEAEAAEKAAAEQKAKDVEVIDEKEVTTFSFLEETGWGNRTATYDDLALAPFDL